MKRRQLFYVFNVGGKDENTILVTEETNDKWIAPLSRIVEPNPKDALQLFFGSERDGFNHLYLATLDKSKFKDGKANAEIKQLTKGNWQVEWAKWLADGKQIIYSSTKNNTATRDFFVYDLEAKESLAAFKNFSAQIGGKRSIRINPQDGMKIIRKLMSRILSRFCFMSFRNGISRRNYLQKNFVLIVVQLKMRIIQSKSQTQRPKVLSKLNGTRRNSSK